MNSSRLFDLASEKEQQAIGCAMLTLVEKRGRTPRRSARLLLFSDGSCRGTLGGGEEEALLIRRAGERIRNGRSGYESLSVRGKGEVKVFVDVINPEKKAVLFSAGHVAKALYEVLHFLRYEVTVVDSRTDLNSPDRFSFARRLSDTSELMVDSATALVFFDPEKAEELLDSLGEVTPFYVGVMSSRSRSFSDSRMTFPAGLDLGAESPEEIALSIASELEAARNRRSARPLSKDRSRLVVVRGAGDLASGVILRLHHAGFKVVALEVGKPSVIRRTVSFAEAVYEGRSKVEDLEAELASSLEQVPNILDEGRVPILVDPEGRAIEILKPVCVVDAIIAKKNLGTRISMAPFVIALGPGFEAGVDCNVVVETKRGHDLGRLIWKGQAEANTGVPGSIMGFSSERVIHSPSAGLVRNMHGIGDLVDAGEILGYVGDTPFVTTISGMVRGLIREGSVVPSGFKIADVDPRGEKASYLTVSDKARSISGAVLEALCGFLYDRERNL